MNMVLLPYESADGIRRNEGYLLASGQAGYGYARVFIGPEGGFEDEEVELARENGAEIVTLGKENLADGDGRLVYAVGTDAAVGSVIGKLQRR